MNKRRIGLILMLLASAFFIFGSYWYMDLAHSVKDWGARLEFGLRIGIPAVVFFLAAWLSPRLGSLVAVIISVPVLLLFLSLAFLGDMEERLAWSLASTATVYSIGAVMVLLAVHKENSIPQ